MKIPLRFKIIRKNCRGKILNLGSTNDEGGITLQSYISETKKVYSADIYGKCDYRQDLSQPVWKNIKGKFDTIIAGEIIEHIENHITFIKNCHRLLNKNGRLILSTPNATSLMYLRNPAWCTKWHVHAFTIPMLENILKDNHFQVEYKAYLTEFVKNPLGKIICFIFPRLRGDLFIIARKNEKT